MQSMQVVGPALAVDIEKMKIDFVHDYQLGVAVLYVCTQDFQRNECNVLESDRSAWSPH